MRPYICVTDIAMASGSNLRIRAAALDLDGTIIGPDELITPVVADAIGRLSARIPVFIATGREPQDVFEYASQLGLTGPQLSDGGAAILDPVACRHIWSANLGPELSPEVLRLIERLDGHFVATHVQGTFRRVGDIPDGDVVRISALDLSREEAETLVRRFRGHPQISVILASLPYNGLWAVDFTRSGVDKGSGIARMGRDAGGLTRRISPASATATTTCRCSRSAGLPSPWAARRMISRAPRRWSSPPWSRTDWPSPSATTSCRG